MKNECTALELFELTRKVFSVESRIFEIELEVMGLRTFVDSHIGPEHANLSAVEMRSLLASVSKDLANIVKGFRDGKN